MTRAFILASTAFVATTLGIGFTFAAPPITTPPVAPKVNPNKPVEVPPPSFFQAKVGHLKITYQVYMPPVFLTKQKKFTLNGTLQMCGELTYPGGALTMTPDSSVYISKSGYSDFKIYVDPKRRRLCNTVADLNFYDEKQQKVVPFIVGSFPLFLDSPYFTPGTGAGYLTSAQYAAMKEKLKPYGQGESPKIFEYEFPKTGPYPGAKLTISAKLVDTDF